MFELNFKLKQHTPLIHFQHSQPNATLRATEVKAKLDRFITLELKKAYPSLWIKYQSVVSDCFNETSNAITGDYKLSIKAELDKWFVVSSYLNPKEVERADREYGVKILNNTAYFADAEGVKNGLKRNEHNSSTPFQNGDFSEIRKGLMFKDIQIDIFSFHPDLLEMLDEIIPIFFCNYNFGTRQTKGFGCFSVEGYGLDWMKNKLKENLTITAVFEKRLNGQSGLQKIQTDYQLIKSGRSFGGYQKSLLWKYLCDKQGISWEKRMVKKEIQSTLPSVWNAIKYDDKNSSEHRISNCANDESNNFQYIRALLGLAEQIEFLPWNSRDKILIKISDTKNEIDRYPSPILFKEVGDSILIIGKEIDEALFTSVIKENGQEIKVARQFTFDLDAKVSNKRMTSRLGSPLKVPSTFNLAAFLQFALKDSGVISGYAKIK